MNVQAKARRITKVQCAYEVVVVIKSEPVKAGNCMEDKTWMTIYIVKWTFISQKFVKDAKDGREIEVCWKTEEMKIKVFKYR